MDGFSAFVLSFCGTLVYLYMFIFSIVFSTHAYVA